MRFAPPAFLAPPWPNPANSPANLRVGISPAEEGARASVRIHDLAGRLVRTVQDGPLSAGVHTLTWDLHDESGRTVAPGLYLVRAETNRFTTVHRVIVIR